MPVLIAQFLKGRDSGELHALAKIPEITLLRGKAGDKFTFQMDERELQQTYDENSKLLLSVVEAARAGKCKLLILDEIMGSLATETVDADLLRSLVEQKPAGLELVLTGRNPPDWLVEAADYVSEIKKQKHPFDRGIPAREGIEL